jgi:hypothetical protein
MKLKKLTLAAVLVSMSLIAAGTNGGVAAENDIATLSTPAAQVKESGFKEVASVTDIPVVTGSACPIQTCQPACPCEPKCEPAPCEPCGSACPIADPCLVSQNVMLVLLLVILWSCLSCYRSLSAKLNCLCVCPNTVRENCKKVFRLCISGIDLWFKHNHRCRSHSISLSESHGIMVSRDAGNLNSLHLLHQDAVVIPFNLLPIKRMRLCRNRCCGSLPCFRDLVLQQTQSTVSLSAVILEI